jgi:hypothetical protein
MFANNTDWTLFRERCFWKAFVNNFNKHSMPEPELLFKSIQYVAALIFCHDVEFWRRFRLSVEQGISGQRTNIVRSEVYRSDKGCREFLYTGLLLTNQLQVTPMVNGFCEFYFKQTVQFLQSQLWQQWYSHHNRQKKIAHEWWKEESGEGIGALQ